MRVLRRRVLARARGQLWLAALALALRFKRSGDRFLLELFPGVEFDVSEPTPDAFQPVLDALYDAIATHYERGLDLFLENRAGKLHIPFATPRPRPVPEAKPGDGKARSAAES